mgnify:CR=1 FL=1
MAGALPVVVRAYFAHIQPDAKTIMNLHKAAEPRRQEVIRRLNLAPHGTEALVRIDPDNNLLLIKGALPGPNGGLLFVRKSITARVPQGGGRPAPLLPGADDDGFRVLDGSHDRALLLRGHAYLGLPYLNLAS